jgi:uncharacterized protein YcbK (DUF882 family)
MGDLSANFSKNEFSCHCGCGFDDISPDLVNYLQHLRDSLGEPIHVLSGCRCELHNKRCGGKVHSQHLLGTAADIFVDSLSPVKLHKYIDENADVLGIKGLGLYSTFVHVDVRPEPARWHG